MGNEEEIKLLVQQTVGGDTGAFEKLYLETNQRVYFICLNFLHSENDAKDAVQDTYLTAFKNIRQLSEPQKFKSWVERIAVNRCKDILKKNQPIPVDDDILKETLITEDEFTIPEKYIADKEKRRILMDIIRAKLSELQYQTIILYYFNNLSISEIAEIMECSEGSVKNRLSKARAAIKKAINQYQKDKDDKLFVFAGVPFLAKVFDEESKTLTAPALNTSMLTGSITSGAVISSVSETVKTGGTVMSKKVLIGVLAGVVAISTIGAGAAIIGMNTGDGKNFAESDTTESVGVSSGNTQQTPSDSTEQFAVGNNGADYNEMSIALDLHNPRNPETQEVNFSYVYFGSYPQTEIAAEKANKTKAEVAPELFAKLESATDWDSNDDIVIDGVKYRRSNNERIDNIRNITYNENTEVTAPQPDYKWFDTNNPGVYHYFRYEPVKWRVLEINGDSLLLAAEKEIDVISYGDNISYIKNGETTHNLADSWKNSRVRSFLNGLGSSENIAKSDFEGKGVLQTLFTEDERSFLTPFTSEGGTSDLLVIPSVDDYSGENGYNHGFAKLMTKTDSKRKSFSTDYAAYDYRTVLLRDDPHHANDKEKTLAAYAVKSDGSIGTSYQEIVCGVVPMVRISVSCPYLQIAKNEE